MHDAREIWFGLGWVLSCFFDHYIQSSVPYYKNYPPQFEEVGENSFGVGNRILNIKFSLSLFLFLGFVFPFSLSLSPPPPPSLSVCL